MHRYINRSVDKYVDSWIDTWIFRKLDKHKNIKIDIDK